MSKLSASPTVPRESRLQDRRVGQEDRQRQDRDHEQDGHSFHRPSSVTRGVPLLPPRTVLAAPPEDRLLRPEKQDGEKQ